MGIEEQQCIYDSNADVLYVTFVDAAAHSSSEEQRSVIIRRAQDGSLIGITILDAQHGS